MIVALITILFSFIAPDQDKFEKVKIDEGISFLLPDNMHAMTDVEIASKYVSYRNALAFYTDEDRMADFIINNSVTPWSANDMEMLHDIYKTNIYNLYNEVEMIHEAIEDFDGRSFICFEFVSRVTGDENSIVKQNDISAYNYVAYTINKNKVYVFTFTCPVRLQGAWDHYARKIISSIKIK